MAPDNLPILELAAPGPDRDSGVAAILAGTKTALTGLVQIYERAAEPLPRVGQRLLVVDSAGRPAAIIELTDVRTVPMGTIDDDHARAEGRGYPDADAWRADHEKFFRSELVSEFLGGTPVIDDQTLVITQRFRLVGPAASAAGA